MPKKTFGLDRPPAERGASDPMAEGKDGERADNVLFHPRYAEQLNDAINQKRRALVVAKQEAVPSIIALMGRLQANPGGLDPDLVQVLTDTLRGALATLETVDGDGQPISEEGRRTLQETHAQLQEALAEIVARGLSPSRR
jgi:hypothetical protein